MVIQYYCKKHGKKGVCLSQTAQGKRQAYSPTEPKPSENIITHLGLLVKQFKPKVRYVESKQLYLHDSSRYS